MSIFVVDCAKVCARPKAKWWSTCPGNVPQETTQRKVLGLGLPDRTETGATAGTRGGYGGSLQGRGWVVPGQRHRAAPAARRNVVLAGCAGREPGVTWEVSSLSFATFRLRRGVEGCLVALAVRRAGGLASWARSRVAWPRRRLPWGFRVRVATSELAQRPTHRLSLKPKSILNRPLERAWEWASAVCVQGRLGV